jgi:hypothetical protein
MQSKDPLCQPYSSPSILGLLLYAFSSIPVLILGIFSCLRAFLGAFIVILCSFFRFGLFIQSGL